MATRLELHEKLCEVLGTRNVYFQPPETIKLKYPCIIYNSVNPDVVRADDAVYNITKCYDLLLIEKDCDSLKYCDILKAFPMCRCNRSFITDGLFHNSLTLYF